jgi:hypothetical protein
MVQGSLIIKKIIVFNRAGVRVRLVYFSPTMSDSRTEVGQVKQMSNKVTNTTTVRH